MKFLDKITRFIRYNQTFTEIFYKFAKNNNDDMKRYIINPSLEAVSRSVEQIQEQLLAWKCKSEQVTQAVLTIEELLVDITQNIDPQEKVFINLKKGLRKTSVNISYKGQKFELKNSIVLPGSEDLSSDLDPTAENVIHEMVLNLMKNRISSKYSRGVNTIRVAVETNEKAALIDSLSAIVLAIVLGLTLRMTVSEDVSLFVASNILQPIYLIFLRAMQLVVAPLIFFSLTSSITGLGDLRSLGRTGSKIMTSYTLTTILAILITIGMDAVMKPGEMGNITLPAAGAAALLGDVPEISTSFKDMIINMMPNNMLGTFVDSDMLQIIVLAILCSVTVGHLGQYSETVKKGIDTMNAFFGTLTGGLTKMLPFAIFGTFGNMVLTTDFASMGALAYWALSTCMATFAMILVYGLMIAVFGRLNPLTFYKKYFKASLTAFSSSSSSATMPTSMECCRKLGVSPSVYNFSIPLGCTINMDGTAIMFMSIVLFLARVYGIDIDMNTLITLITTIMLISFAMPCVPGGGIATLLSILAIAGIPAEGLTIVLGIMSLIELLETAANVTGDGAVTTIVAKSEGQLDAEQYRSATS